MPAQVPQKTLHAGSDGVTLAAGVGGQVSSVATIAVQLGLYYIVPGKFPLVCKLLDGAADEMADGTLFGFAVKVPGDPERPRPVGGMYQYRKWGDLTTAQQSDKDFKDGLIIDLGVPYLFLDYGESLILQAYHASDTVDSTYTEFEIPYMEHDRIAEEVKNLRKQRQFGSEYGLGF